MKRLLIFIQILIAVNVAHAQKIISSIGQSPKRDVTLVNHKIDENFDIYAINHTSVTNEVILTVNSTGMDKHPNTITKLVSAKDSILMVSLKPLKEHTGIRANYKHTPKPTKEEITKKATLIANKTLKKDDDINKGIVVFDKSNCSRCSLTTSYLLDNNIAFKVIKIPTNDQIKNNDFSKELRNNQLLLQKKLRENGVVGTYTTPVILVDGKLTHSHENLREFVKDLSNK